MSENRKKIVVFGSFVVDLMARAPRHPVAGETVFGTSFRMGPGGKGFNQAVAACKAGADVQIVTALGMDDFSHVALDTMGELGMSTEFVRVSATEQTGIALITVDEQSGQNEIVVVPGACAAMTAADAEAVRPLLEQSDILLLQLEVGLTAVERAAKIAKASGSLVVLNPAPVRALSQALYQTVDLIVPNETEAERLTGIPIVDEAAALRAAQWFAARGVNRTLITLGSRGVFLYDAGESRMIPAYNVNCVDSTGAGDAFCGGLVTGLAEGMGLNRAARFANAVAALSVQKLGTAPSMPDRKEIDSFLEAMG